MCCVSCSPRTEICWPWSEVCLVGEKCLVEQYHFFFFFNRLWNKQIPGDRKKNNCWLKKEQQFALFSTWQLMWEPPAVSSAVSQKKGRLQSLRTRRRMSYRHEGIAQALPNEVFQHSRAFLASRRQLYFPTRHPLTTKRHLSTNWRTF